MSYIYIINQKFNSIKDKILDIKTLFTTSTKSIHKARNELKIALIEEQSIVIKAFKVPNLLNQIVYAYFRDSKAKKSYEYSLKIKDFTPQPIAYLEFYKFGLFQESYFISETFNYDFTIREPLLENTFQDREEIFKAFARFTLELHNNNIFHNDYSPGNILIKKNNDIYTFKIVDINRMKFYKLSQDDRAKNFSKLWANDSILEIIATEYAKYYKCDEGFSKRVLYHSNHNKKVKNFKKKLKGKKVID